MNWLYFLFAVSVFLALFIGLPMLALKGWRSIWAKKVRNSYEQMFQDVLNLREKYPMKSHWWNVFYVIWALYLLLFLIPDSVWLNVGVSLPDKANIPKFVLTEMGYTKFPVSVFIFFMAAPVFFVISLVCFFCAITPRRYAKVYFFMREKHRGWLILQTIFMIMSVTVVPWVLWTYPDIYLTPTSGRAIRALNPFESKLKFFIFFSSGITTFFPLMVSLLCLKFAFFLDSLTNKEV
jgi:hypothetical protein